ncbi:phosphotransferase [Protofrankia symbiont of Coriaria ruscifolia]|uniref:Aminoglycoside phosphotransferase n=1 Tax=Candidatus Protofrankia californiensis TaxID=1839754 RepID=A0A1C3PDE4_9ACTN|nr:phosphotransferase [Protofrankia symbiont of Coriaria ruscifolia]SBW27834.1 aminoglycoside phosphotransferase [Candidatus Protofrankia californiensis]
MDDTTALLDRLTAQTGLHGLLSRTPVRVWILSGVERLIFPGDQRVIFKFARKPFTGEADALRHVAAQGIPAPRLIASVEHDGMLGMLLEDLGEPVREATVDDGIAAAVATHNADPAGFLPVLDRKTLIELPGRAAASLADLRSSGRWTDTTDLDGPLLALDDHADRLSLGADLPPFGLCHSEFHPTSLHIGPDGWRLLDWARAFTGPGLLDLASWQGTTGPADPAALRRMIWGYIRAGGYGEASRPRAGLPPEAWALGWHRLWIIAWYLEQATTWINDSSQDDFVAQVVRRHLREAITCLGIPTL